MELKSNAYITQEDTVAAMVATEWVDMVATEWVDTVSFELNHERLS